MPTKAYAHHGNPYLPHSQRTPIAGRAKPRAIAAAVDSNGVPIGTAAMIMEWVGTDPERAMRALDRERGESRPRVTMVTQLDAVIRKARQAELVAVEAPSGDHEPEAE